MAALGVLHEVLVLHGKDAAGQDPLPVAHEPTVARKEVHRVL
eukprot:CAMPEP_0181274650 /NCGR_PEP_ID=MMETSP1097-20121128/9383_1 /TAXON_ID=35684 /ORGANISM="Pseudopedinella elastica, Strain CCMP716" /LENGTH=41 /DNA_ID= /DNA_START= /DNA_END= /DNA_ORIENTATION=